MYHSDQYAVIGNPIAQSLSPQIHRQFALQMQQNIRYEKILAPLDGFAHAVKDFYSQGGRGLNITAPFKLEAARVVSELTERARLATTVNTIKFNDDQHWLGDNTDGVGLVRDLLQNQHYPINAKKVLLLGAGGAAQGVILPLLQQAPQSLVLANRTKEKAEVIAARFKPYQAIKACSLAELTDMGSFDIVINSTSAGLHAEQLVLPETLLSPNSFCYDMIYHAKPTLFLQWAMAKGVAHYADGLGMLVEQAAESFQLWRGLMPDTKPVLNMIKKQIHHFSL